MYENMLNNYMIWFEGLTEPVFYKSFYPMGEKDTEWLWELFNYSQGLKLDKDGDGRKFNAYRQRYIDDLRELFNTVIKDMPSTQRGVVAIPSSKARVVNRVTSLIREVLANNPRPFKDLTQVVYRCADKESAHVDGKRSFQDNIQTIDIKDTSMLNSCKVIVVIDDILTTGKSFNAMNWVLRNKGFEGQIVNFAFARTFPTEGLKAFLNHEKNFHLEGFSLPDSSQRTLPKKIETVRYGFHFTFEDGGTKISNRCSVTKKAQYRKELTEHGTCRIVFDPSVQLKLDDGTLVDFRDLDDVRNSMKNISYRLPIGAIIFDFDQTLLEDPIRDIEYEKNLGSLRPRKRDMPYRLYDGIKELMGLQIPFAVLSNRPENQLIELFHDRSIAEGVYPERYNLSNYEDGHECYLNRIYHTKGEIRPDKILIQANSMPRNVFSFPAEIVDGYYRRYYKPSLRGVNQAINFLFENFNLSEDDARIIGVGNTHDDIIAYNMSGLESCLALWGVPKYLQQYAIDHWGADYAFYTVEEFIEWCSDGGVFIAKS